MSEFYDNKKICDNRRERNKIKMQEGSKQRLKKIVGKNFQTVMIGAIAAFEDGFGYLWGNGLHYNELTDEQKEFREIWEDVRNRVLDLGHQKKNGSLEEISHHTITWDLYQTTILLKERNYEK